MWPAVHRLDAATMYRLAIEKKPEQRIFHAIGDRGVPFKQIAETIGKGLNIPVVSKRGDDATAYFTWFAHFAGMNCPSSNDITCEALGWEPTGRGLIDDLLACYF